MAPEERERAALNAERLLYPLHSNKRPDRLRSASGRPIADQMLDLADLFTALHPKFWRVVGSYPFKAIYGEFLRADPPVRASIS
ncbi:hypothetical protein M2315_005238 [Agrobacterium fabrum]|nr:hypothetical protein [Agrobacterium fabrum]